MRWEHKNKNMPKPGTIRRRTAFLWLPQLDIEDYWRWLEFADIEEEWSEVCICVDVAICRTGDFKWFLKKVLPRGVNVNIIG